MNPSEIKDQASLRVWLEGQTREAVVTLAHRTAMRVAPLFWSEKTLVNVRMNSDLTDQETPSILFFLLIESTMIKPRSMYAKEFNELKGEKFSQQVGKARSPSDNALGAAGMAASAARITTFVDSHSSASAVFGELWALEQSASSKIGRETNADLWGNIQKEAAAFLGHEFNGFGRFLPLWTNQKNPLSGEWQKVRTAWLATNDPGWHFWADWYDAALEGRPLLGDWDRHWALLTDIALIAPEVWDQGPDAVNPVVAKIAERHRTRADNAEPTPAEEVASVVASAPSSSKTEVVRRAMETNRDAIPHNLDALEAFLLLEIERLQQSNHLNAVAPDECARMIRNLVTMYEVIQSLRSRLPDTRPVNEAEAQESEALLRLFWDKLRDLPRDKADGLVEAVWHTGAGIVQGGLIFGSTSLAVAYGLPALAGVATGALLFAPDKAAVIINAARGSFPKS